MSYASTTTPARHGGPAPRRPQSPFTVHNLCGVALSHRDRHAFQQIEIGRQLTQKLRHGLVGLREIDLTEPEGGRILMTLSEQSQGTGDRPSSGAVGKQIDTFGN